MFSQLICNWILQFWSWIWLFNSANIADPRIAELISIRIAAVLLMNWWLIKGAGQAAGLPDSWDAFWRVVIDAGRGGRRVYTSSAPLSLPGGLKNPRIRPFMSGAYAGTIPAEILPLRPEEERMIVETMLTELNDKFCVGLDPSPSLDRSTPPSPTAHNTGRTAFSLFSLSFHLIKRLWFWRQCSKFILQGDFSIFMSRQRWALLKDDSPHCIDFLPCFLCANWTVESVDMTV